MSTLSLAAAAKLSQATVDAAAAMNLKPIAIAIVDTAGDLMHLVRQDGASPLRPDIALGKATYAARMRQPSAELAKMFEDRPQFAEALSRLADRAFVPAAGGVPIMESSGRCVGAIGVSGDSSDRDAAAATSGVEAIGLMIGN